MDISGFIAKSRSTGLMQAAYDPKRKSRRRGQRPLSPLGRGVLAVVVLLLLYGGLRFLQRQPSTPAADPDSHKMHPVGSSRHSAAAAGDIPEDAAAAAASRTEKLMQQRVERGMRIIPSYRGPGKIETFPHFANANRVLLATHNRLMWYRYDTDELTIVHEGQGVYYGAFPGEERDVLGAPSTLWVVSRPHNWRPTTTQEWLLHLDMETGRELGRVQIDSKFTHDTVRRRDKVYVCSTGEGKILELTYPNMTMVRELPLFTLKEHVNTLAPTVDGKLWALLHNLGRSILVEVDLATGKELRRLPNVGEKAHGIVFWDKWIIMLDSDAGALVRVDPGSGAVEKLWQIWERNRYFKGLCVVDDVAFFGIAVKQGRGQRNDPSLNCELAAFDLRQGLLLWRRQLPTRGLLNIVAAPHLAVESTVYSVNTNRLISYRDKPAYAEALAAAQRQQQQGDEATVHGDQMQQQQQAQQQRVEEAIVRGAVQEGQEVQQQRRRQQEQEAVQQNAQQQQQAEQQQQHAPGEQQQQQQDAPGEQQQQGGAGAQPKKRLALSEYEPLPAGDPLIPFPPLLDTVRWSSGLPRLALAKKSQEHGMATGAQLQLFRTNVTALKEVLNSIPDSDWNEETQRVSNAWVQGRAKNLNKFKPGTRSIMLIFSDQDGGMVFRFPWYDRFKRWVEPWVEEILGVGDMNKIMRLQFALMPPHSEIKRHMDTGGYAQFGHRIHVVIQSNKDVSFHVCDARAVRTEGGGQAFASNSPNCYPIHVEEGLVFELNNRLVHFVNNDSDQNRIHLVVDVAESPREQIPLRVGEICDYKGAKIVCPGRTGTVAGDASGIAAAAGDVAAAAGAAATV